MNTVFNIKNMQIKNQMINMFTILMYVIVLASISMLISIISLNLLAKSETRTYFLFGITILFLNYLFTRKSKQANVEVLFDSESESLV